MLGPRQAMARASGCCTSHRRESSRPRRHRLARHVEGCRRRSRRPAVPRVPSVGSREPLRARERRGVRRRPISRCSGPRRDEGPDRGRATAVPASNRHSDPNLPWAFFDGGKFDCFSGTRIRRLRRTPRRRSWPKTSVLILAGGSGRETDRLFGDPDWVAAPNMIRIDGQKGSVRRFLLSDA